MTDEDQIAEAMRLVNEYAEAKAWGASMWHVLRTNEARGALEAHLRAALAAARDTQVQAAPPVADPAQEDVFTEPLPATPVDALRKARKAILTSYGCYPLPYDKSVRAIAAREALEAIDAEFIISQGSK